MDVLVCGGCHSVFHFIQDFQNHRQQKECSEQSSIRDGNVVRIPFLLSFDFVLYSLFFYKLILIHLTE